MHLNVVTAAAVAASLVNPTLAFWRLPCRGRLGVARMDPIVDPGKASSHAHVIHGAGNFAIDLSEGDLLGSDCTSCAVTQDKSAYWSPALYFVRPDGSSELAKQVGGKLVYYKLVGDDVEPFPKGLRILAGDPHQRNDTGEEKTQFGLGQKALGFNCMNYNAAAEPAMHRHHMPDKQKLDNDCTNGIRAEIAFPSCWNGKDLDSEDHKSHMAYPDMVDGGTCPEGFPHRTVTLFYETIWDTHSYAGQEGQFVWANGDPTGYGYHADFIEGWEDDVLERAVKTCTSDSGVIEDCPVFDLQSQSKQDACKMTVPSILKSEKIESLLTGLPGAVPIMKGPEYAKMPTPDLGLDLPFGKDSSSSPAPSSTAEPAAGDNGNKLEIGAKQPIKGLKQEEPAPSSSSLKKVAPAPAPTPAPEPAEQPLSTTTYTKDNTVYEVVIMQDQVTKTVDAPETPAAKRHIHGHARRRLHQ